MSPRKCHSAVLDADDDVLSLDNAEAAALTAETRAEAARARADVLRTQAKAASRADRLSRWRSRWRSRRPVLLRTIAVGAAVLIIAASLGATGYMLLQHRAALAEERRAAESAAAARQSVVTVMTIDPATIKQDVQRMIDNSTGPFKRALEAGSADAMVAQAGQAKVKTKVTVQAVAVESVTADSAVVLAAATSEGTAPDNTPMPVQTWRLSLTLDRDDGQLKLSSVDFV